jgi:membrane-bound metal-dependent hydrolase YbcI (DUF457 family)
MPFTPLHFGPALLFGFLLFPYLDLPTFLVSNVIVDVEPFLVLYLGLSGPLHGPFHSYTLGALVALGTALVMLLMKPITRPVMSLFKLRQEFTPKRIFVTALLGIYLHVTLDAFLYPEMSLLYPLQFNPLLGLVSSESVYLFCSLSFLPGLALYAYKLLRS